MYLPFSIGIEQTPKGLPFEFLFPKTISIFRICVFVVF
jgi:hypothetical protein